MFSRFNDNRIVVFLIAAALLPLLSGNAFHRFLPCTQVGESAGCCAADHGHAPCDSHDEDHDSEPVSSDSCPLCDVLAMPRTFALPVVVELVADLVQWRELPIILPDVVPYRSFEYGRAPPVVA